MGSGHPRVLSGFWGIPFCRQLLETQPEIPPQANLTSPERLVHEEDDGDALATHGTSG